MLQLNFSQIIDKLDVKKVNKYIKILSISDPNDAEFQQLFADFFTLNPTYWVKNKQVVGTSGLTRKELFFSIFDKYIKMGKNNVDYSSIIQDLSCVPMRKGNGNVQVSFSSKILHVIDVDKPIIDQKMMLKLARPNSNFKSSVGLKVTGKKKFVAHIGNGQNNDQKIKEAIDFYSEVELYYNTLKADPATKTYLDDFDYWCKNTAGIDDSKLISETKKIDFWMWLA